MKAKIKKCLYSFAIYKKKLLRKVAMEKFSNERGGTIQKYREAIDDGTPSIL